MARSDVNTLVQFHWYTEVTKFLHSQLSKYHNKISKFVVLATEFGHNSSHVKNETTLILTQLTDVALCS